METVGYCTIKKDATTCKGTNNPERFIGKDCRVIEFAPDGGVLVLDSEATGLAMFDKQDVYRKFECSVSGDVICPPNMGMLEQMVYATKVMTRKGGYNQLLKGMVIQASLMKGKFTDDFLFQKEREENARNQREGKPSNPASPLEFMMDTMQAVYAPIIAKAKGAREKVKEYKKLSEIEQKIIDLEYQLQKWKSSDYTRGKPRRLRRLLRRLRGKIQAPSMAK